MSKAAGSTARLSKPLTHEAHMFRSATGPGSGLNSLTVARSNQCSLSARNRNHTGASKSTRSSRRRPRRNLPVARRDHDQRLIAHLLGHPNACRPRILADRSSKARHLPAGSPALRSSCDIRFIAGLPTNPRDESIRRPMIHFRRRIVLLNFSVAHHGDAMRQRHGLGLIVRHVQRSRCAARAADASTRRAFRRAGAHPDSTAAHPSETPSAGG